jgi:hypothetical protein
MELDDVLIPEAAAEHNLLGGFVVNKADNKPELVPPTGFILAEQAGPPTPMVQVANLVATTGDNDGEIDLAWDAQRAADGYEIQLAVDAPSGFATKDFTGYSKSMQGGLPSLKKVWFRVRAIAATTRARGATRLRHDHMT